MNITRRITANIPENLLLEAEEVTGKGITATLIEGLKLIKRSRAYDRAQKLKNIKLDVNIDISRERSSH